MKIFLSFLALSLSYVSIAQTESSESVRPLIVIDTQLTYNELMILHPSKFVSIYTINPEKAIQIYGSSGKYGAIKIETKPDIRVVRIKDLLDKFNIQEKYRNLKVRIDNTPITDPAKLLADLDEIKNVEIGFAKTDQNTTELFNGDLFINIVTQSPR